MRSSRSTVRGRLHGWLAIVPAVGPIAFILVFLVVPLAAGLVVLVFLVAALAAKAFAALPLVTWALMLAALFTGEVARRRIGRQRHRTVETA